MQLTLTHEDLISEGFRNRFIARVMRDHQINKELAERIINGTLKFLNLCVDYPEQSFAPYKQIDIGWHTFLLYTREYADFCSKIAGRFIHHAPNDKVVRRSSNASKTREFMIIHRIYFDDELWPISTEYKKCDSDCDPGPQGDCGEGDCNSEGNA